MGLDNYIDLRAKVKHKFFFPALFKNFQGDVTTICYWRNKHWLMREICFKTGRTPNVTHFYLTRKQLKTVLKLVKQMKVFYSDSFRGKIREMFSEEFEWWPVYYKAMNIIALYWLLDYNKKHPDIKIEFLNSY